ncbi:DUF3592 domain-containing protein [Cognatilysobacter bugurensis]|uniref:DUF3592 domain-containing protein n=1 Tax=Cognatilysobacter bugurensis TaxID=543356 RepID=A0A918W5L5_9GAMM|nr:DUF3592 domain-containing protein [Lysobacter bugurensis]GHA68594.1 hypothetical protein GCM10007067_00550 [Lysobacter bugurensis]
MMLKPLLMLVAVAYAAWQLRAWVLGQASWCWRATRATVIEAYRDEHVHPESRHIVHSANVRYRYKVGSRTFVSQRLSYRPTRFLGFSQAGDLLEGLAMNRETTAYVNPRNPAQAVLVQGADFGNLLQLVVALLAIGAVLSLPT